MRLLSSVTIRAIAAFAGAAALVLTLASVTGAPKPSHKTVQLALLTPHMLCPPGICGD